MIIISLVRHLQYILIFAVDTAAIYEMTRLIYALK